MDWGRVDASCARCVAKARDHLAAASVGQELRHQCPYRVGRIQICQHKRPLAAYKATLRTALRAQNPLYPGVVGRGLLKLGETVNIEEREATFVSQPGVLPPQPFIEVKSELVQTSEDGQRSYTVAAEVRALDAALAEAAETAMALPTKVEAGLKPSKAAMRRMGRGWKAVANRADLWLDQALEPHERRLRQLLSGATNSGQYLAYQLVGKPLEAAVHLMFGKGARSKVSRTITATVAKDQTEEYPVVEVNPARYTVATSSEVLESCEYLPALVAHLANYACFRKRTYDLLMVLKARALVWLKEQEIKDEQSAKILAPSVALAFRLSAPERSALHLLNAHETQDAVEQTTKLASEASFTASGPSVVGWLRGENGLFDVANAKVRSLMRPGVMLPRT